MFSKEIIAPRVRKLKYRFSINQMKDIFENVFCNNISEESYKYLISFYLDLFKAEDFDDVAKISNVARLQLKRNSEDIVKSYQDIINDCVDYINDAILFYPSKSYIKQTLMSFLYLQKKLLQCYLIVIISADGLMEEVK